MKQKDQFDVLGLTPADAAHPGVAAALARSGGVGLLDLEFCRDEAQALANFRRLLSATEARIGLRLTAGSVELARRMLALLTGERALVLLFAGGVDGQAQALAALRPDTAHTILAEVTDASTLAALGYPHHGLVAKGHEAGGWVGADTSYILLQKLAGKTDKPVYVQGGVGIHSAAACRILGAAGVVLDDQLLLLAESPLPDSLQNELARLNGSETRLFGELIDAPCRIYSRPGTPAQKAADDDNRGAESGALEPAQWRVRLEARLAWNGGPEQLMPLGQGIGVAAIYRSQYRSVGRLVQALRKSSLQQIENAAQLGFMAPGGPLAVSHGTRYPLAQGPMTRVSDNPEFAYQVSLQGGLPFLALALMRGPQVLEMLQQTKAKMGNLPWGVGMLGFVPHSLREEQCAAIWECKPTYALIAGGRPDQAAEFEKRGIPTYIHAPAPALLKMYIEQGARRFVFEGRECGGHIGPLASFPLWEQMTELLLAEVKPGSEGEYHLLFAGGLNDARSGAMLAALTAPLAARGIKVGGLMGTAYLFTREIVQSGAVVEGFQAQALQCSRTVNVESGPGHSTRCAVTPFAQDFQAMRRKLLQEGRSSDEIRDALEDLNLGRLRIASKGLNRDASGALVGVEPRQQLAEGMYMIGQVATLRERVQSIDELHSDVTVGGNTLLREYAARRTTQAEAATPSDIAIIGLGTLLPKAHEADQYWHNILEQVCVIGEVPASRWDWKLYFDANRNARDKVYSRWGGFLDEVAFDPISYGIPPKSMKHIDPMQLLTLEVTRRALADAGYAGADFDRENTSIILGAGGGLGDLGTQYAVRSEIPRFVENPDPSVWERLPEWTEESFAGSLLNVAAGRVANRMDFGGVNMIVDAACASSLMAISVAVNELESGRSNFAIAGGVDTVQSPFGFLSFSKTQALSATGSAKTFDQGADGICISEGLAVVVMKRLADAERDGDRIYAVIKAAAGSSDGKALGLTAPRPEGQKRALKRAYARAGFSPATLGMIEAHGTGTPVGDRAEAQTITETLAAHGAAPRSCAIGSVKTLLGHTKAGAGVSGLIKAVLALHHRTLPAHYGVSKPIDTIADPNSPVYLLKDARPWLAHPDHPRRAGVSAFGFGGTNCHAVLEEYCSDFSGAAPGAARWPYELFVFQAKDEAALAGELGRFTTALRQGTNLKLRDLAFSLARQAATQRGAALRMAVVAKDFTSLLADLEAALAHLSVPGGKPLPQSVRLGRNLGAQAPQVAWLFPGQGSQYVNMGRETSLYVEELREALELADLTLRADFPQLLSRSILPIAAFDEETEQKQSAALTDTRVAQPAIGTLALGYLRFAQRLGIGAVAAAGHSYGEYAALLSAGVLAPQDFLRLSAVRGRCMGEAARSSAPGAMAAVQARREIVAQAIAGLDGVKIANHNAPEQAVISGPAAAVESAAKKLEAGGARVSRLPVSGAFHTELVAGAQIGLSAAIGATPLAAPRCTVYSNTTGAPYPSDSDGIRRTLDGHLLNSVEFVAEIEAMYAAGVRVFVELGPKGVCSNMAKQTLAGRDATAVSLDGQGGGMRGMLLGLAELFAAGVELQLLRLFDQRGAQALELSRLAELVKPVPLPKHAWWVSGGAVRPLDDPSLRTGKLPALDLAAAQAAREKANRSVPAAAAPMPALVAPPATAAVHAPLAPSMVAPASALGSEVLIAYQQTMRQFLNLQERVIQQFLGQPAGAVPVQTSLPGLPLAPAITAPAAPTAASVAALVAAPVAAPEPEPAKETAAPSFAAQTVLLEIVADRTGYPPEMLGLDQDLEAELGIDSIKRVEILGALQKRLPAALAVAMQSGMERYTRAKTLNAILAQVQRDTADTPAAPTADVISVAAAPAALDRAGLQAQLLALVADRTGYPPEMLGLDQDLEAELGIDSIKRVEILGAMQKVLPAVAAEAMQSGMEKFTKARSLNAILDAALALTPVTAAPAEAAVRIAAPAAATAAPALDRAGLQAQLLAIVADRTGYPPEMLGLDQDLEAELGIDSIKRVEILGAMQKVLPAVAAEAMQSGMEKFTKARSLNAILDAALALTPVTVAPAATASGEPSGAPKAPEPAAQAERTPRYVPRPRLAPLPAQRRVIEGLYLLTADADGIAQRLADRIVSAGARALVLPAAAITSVEALRAALNGANATGAVRGVVHLGGLEVKAADDLESWKEHTERQAKSLFRLLQVNGPDLSARDSVALAVSRFGGSLGREAAGSGLPAAGAAVGLFNCAVAEWPKLLARLVDFDDSAGADDIADALFDELGAADARTEVGYRGGERIGVVHCAEDPEDHPFAPHLTPAGDWVVLVTGGARGITAEIAEELVRPGLRLVLLGRTPLPGPEDPATASLTEGAPLKRALLERALAAGRKPTPAEMDRACRAVLADREIRANLQRLAAAGAQVDYRACDVRDPEAFGTLIDQLYAQHGRIDAVVHGAGVIEDKRIADKTADSFDRVYDTKVDSAFVLSRKLRPESLKLLAFFTSVAGRFGNLGQADYGAANETLNRLAWQLHRAWQGVRVVAINWGPWNAGMANEAVRNGLRARGIEPIPVPSGRRFFLDEMAYGPRNDVEVVAGAGPWHQESLAAAAAPQAAITQHALPFVRQALRMGGGGAVTLEQHFSVRDDLYLSDHVVNGKAVLPAAVALEYLAQFVAAGWPELQIAEIRDVREQGSIELDADDHRAVILRARSSTHSEAGQQAVTVEMLDPLRKLVCYRATALLMPQLPDSPQAQLLPLTAAKPFQVSAAYSDLLRHGSRFQLLTGDSSMSPEGIDGQVLPSSPRAFIGERANGSRWLFDPGLLNTAPQLASVWAHAHQSRSVAPCRFGRVARFGVAPLLGPLSVSFRVVSAEPERPLLYDALYFDSSGHVRLAVFDGESNVRAAADRLAGNL